MGAAGESRPNPVSNPDQTSAVEICVEEACQGAAGTKQGPIHWVLQSLSQARFVASIKVKSIGQDWGGSIVRWLLFLGFHIFIGYATYIHILFKRPWSICNGMGFIWSMVCLTYFYLISGKCLRSKLVQAALLRVETLMPTMPKFLIPLAYGLGLVGVATFLVADTWGEPHRMIPFGGLLVLVFLMWLFSKDRSKVQWRQIWSALLLQIIFGLLILRWEPGKDVLECIGSKVDGLLSFTDVGSSITYGHLVHRKPFLPALLPNDSVAFEVTSMVNKFQAAPSVVVFKALSVIYFFSFLTSILTHLGYVQAFTVRLGSFLRLLLGTSLVESVNAAANIFLGQTMTPILIAPYISRLTLSEVHAVMTAGFATIAGATMAAYISFGVSASHLLSASLMSAPAALACAKLLYPDESPPNIDLDMSSSTGFQLSSGQSKGSLIDAATNGAISSALMVLNIAAIVVACVATMAFLDSLVAFVGSLVLSEEDYNPLTFQWILGKLFVPLSFIMGVEWKDCQVVAELIGLKTVVNEFIAYRQMSSGIEDGTIVLSPRTMAIATYALCGYANPASIGCQLATLGSLCPERGPDFAKVAIRAFVAGSAACFMTACVAGILISDRAI